MMNNQINSIVG